MYISVCATQTSSTFSLLFCIFLFPVSSTICLFSPRPLFSCSSTPPLFLPPPFPSSLLLFNSSTPSCFVCSSSSIQWWILLSHPCYAPSLSFSSSHGPALFPYPITRSIRGNVRNKLHYLLHYKTHPQRLNSLNYTCEDWIELVNVVELWRWGYKGIFNC